MTFDIPMDPAKAPTAQEKGVRVVKGVPMFYKKKALVDFERELTAHIDAQRKGYRIPKGEAVFFHVAFMFSWPLSTPMKRRADWEPMVQRPDGENLTKAVVDCFGDRYRKEGGRWVVAHEGVFPDDSAIAPLVVSKFRTTGRPRILVRVCPRAEWVRDMKGFFWGIDTPRKGYILRYTRNRR